jgi:hypothetical protein
VVANKAIQKTVQLKKRKKIDFAEMKMELVRHFKNK